MNTRELFSLTLFILSLSSLALLIYILQFYDFKTSPVVLLWIGFIACTIFSSLLYAEEKIEIEFSKNTVIFIISAFLIAFAMSMCFAIVSFISNTIAFPLNLFITVAIFLALFMNSFLLFVGIEKEKRFV